MPHLQKTAIFLVALCALLGTGCSKQAQATRHLSKGDGYFAAGDYERAEIEYLNVVRLNQTNRAAIRNLGFIYFSNDALGPALGYLNAAKKLADNDPELRGKLARAFLSAGGVKEARVEAEAALALDPANEFALLALVDAAATPEENKAVQETIEALRRKAGDKALYHTAAGIIALRSQNIADAERLFKKALELDANFSAAHWALGNLYWSQQKLPEAEKEMKTAVDLSPLRSGRRLRFAEFKLQSKAQAEARQIVDDLNRKAPDYIPAWILSARMALAEKKYDDALANLDRVLARNPDQFDAISLRADVRIAEGKMDLAVAEIERLVTAYPKAAVVRYRQATVSLLNRNLPQAVAALNQAVSLDTNHVPSILLLAELNIRRGEAAAAIVALTDLIRRQPSNEQAHFTLASAYQAAGRLDDSIALYQRMLTQFAKNPNVPLMLGIAYRQKGNSAEARKSFEEALRRAPDSPRVVAQLVEMDIAAKAYDDAVRRVQAQMDKYPKEPQPVYLMATIRRAQNDLPQAEALLEKVIELDPNSMGAYLLLARVYFAAKKVTPALEKLNGILAKNPKDASALTMMGMIYSQSGDEPKAIEIYEKLLTASPDSLVALNNLASLYTERPGQLDRAYELARKAEQMQPNNPQIADTFGWILTRRGDYALALNILRESARAVPDNAEILYHLGTAYYMTGNESAARDALTRSLQLSGDFQGRATVEKLLTILNINSAAADAQARAVLTTRLEEMPADPVALSRLAAIYQKEKNAGMVTGLYENALRSNPKMGIVMARLGELYSHSASTLPKAMELVRGARLAMPEDPEAARLAGQVALRSHEAKDQQWALSLLQDSNQRQKGNAETLHQLAVAYFSQGMLTECEATLREAFRVSPNFSGAESAKRLLDFLPLISDPARAIQNQNLIQQALKNDPQDPVALLAQASAVGQRGEGSLVISSLETVLARYPGFAPALRSLTILLAGNANEAQKAAEFGAKALERYPGDAELSKAAGTIAYHRRDYARAATLLADAARKRPQDAQLYYFLGMAQAQQKKNREGKEALSKALELQPNGDFATEARRVLATLN